ncbi:MAG: cytoplasmic protein, partial [Deltaproteobacteria bacterium]|nr:cytoplasmic protein [Deltaproteobacteria bacterium]
MIFDTIQVECYSGYRANERPLAFTWRGKRRVVEEIKDRWYEGGRSANAPALDYFKVTTDEGEEFILRYN